MGVARRQRAIPRLGRQVERVELDDERFRPHGRLLHLAQRRRWRASGPAAVRSTFDPDGSGIYFETGNGSGGSADHQRPGFPTDANYNEAVVKIANDPTTTGGTNRTPTAGASRSSTGSFPTTWPHWTPPTTTSVRALSLLLPASAGVPGHPNLLIAGGKEGSSVRSRPRQHGPLQRDVGRRRSTRSPTARRHHAARQPGQRLAQHAALFQRQDLRR